MTKRLVLLLCASLACGLTARADDLGGGGSMLEQVEVTALGNGARVNIRFRCPLRYISHFPANAMTELRISLAPLPGCGEADSSGSTLRALPGNAAGLGDVRLEPAGTAQVMTLYFSAVVDVAVRPSPDFLGIEVAVIGGMPVVATRPGVRRTPEPGPVAPASVRPLPTDEVLESQWLESRQAFEQADYPTAIRLLTRMIEYPEHPHRADAQEMLGLARERNGHLAHAKAEYQEYLRVYPEGTAVARVRQRLAAITTLDSRPRVEATARQDGGMAWTSLGGWSQEYRRDSTTMESTGVTNDFVSQSMLLSNADLSMRGRGERFDFQTRVNAGYMYDLLPEAEGPGDQTRISVAYAELADRKSRTSARLGRQSRHSGGVLGTFDGLFLGWQALPSMKLNLMSGYPVESTRQPFSTDRQFISLSANLSGWIDGLEFSPFLVNQTFEGVGDRRAVGGEVRWFRPGRTLVGLADYDIDYNALNMVMLLGTFDFPGRWTVTGSLDHRMSPFLTTRNALSGQAVQTLNELIALVGEPAARALAADRTAEADTLSLGVSRPLGTRFQWSVDLTGTQISAMPESGGVPAIPGTGMQLSLGAQLIGTSLISSGDISIIGLRRFQSVAANTTSLSVSSRFPLWGKLRISPRLRLDQREFASDGSTQLLVSPSFRLDWNWKRTTIEFEAGGELSSRDAPLAQEKTNRYWLNLGYRVAL